MILMNVNNLFLMESCIICDLVWCLYNLVIINMYFIDMFFEDI